MSLMDEIRAGMRTVVGSDGLGETLTYETLKGKIADRGVSYADSATLTGFFLEQASALGFEDDGHKDERSARVRTADTETELSIGDRFVRDGYNWEIVGKQRQPGMVVYDLEGRTRKSSGSAER